MSNWLIFGQNSKLNVQIFKFIKFSMSWINFFFLQNYYIPIEFPHLWIQVVEFNVCH